MISMLNLLLKMKQNQANSQAGGIEKRQNNFCKVIEVNKSLNSLNVNTIRQRNMAIKVTY